MHNSTEVSRLLLKVPEVAEATGLANSYIWRLIQKGDLPVVRIGRAVRIRPADLQKFIDERSYDTAA